MGIAASSHHAIDEPSRFGKRVAWRSPSRGRRPGGIPWLRTLLLLLLSSIAMTLAGVGVAVAADVSLSGAATQGPVGTDVNDRFIFPNVPLRRNAINTFEVEAVDAFGNLQTQEINITQISLDEIVVSRVSARPLPPEEIRQLVEDGAIDLEDPENYNVSIFVIVLTIDKEPIEFELPIARRRDKPLGFESPPLERGGRSSSGPERKIPDMVVFEYSPSGSAGGVPLPSIPGVIVIEGRIKSLKEFFEVRLLLMNTSGIFTLSDVTAMIEFPDGGLSTTLPSDGLASFGDILPGTSESPGQAEREFIIRGDDLGERPVRLDFGGFLTGPGIPEAEPIPFNGSAETSVEVRGPPTFEVRVSHPDVVEAFVPYDLEVEITNTGDTPALYASLDLDVGVSANLVECGVDEATGLPACEEIDGASTRLFGDMLPGDRVREVFEVIPFNSGPISSCTGASDQNITLEVSVGNLGCLVGTFPPRRTDTDGRPTVTVVPTAGLFGVSIDAPVVAFFSKLMNRDSISPTSSFQVFGEDGEAIPGQITFDDLIDRTVAVWQVDDGITNRLPGNTELTVVIDDTIRDEEGYLLFERWESRFTTTDPTVDLDPPTVTLDLEPPTDPLDVQPGERLRVNVYPQDQGSRLARVELRIQDVTEEGAASELVDQKTVFDSTTLPCIFVIDSASLIPGHAYQLRATAFDNAGNSQDATLGVVLANGPVPPSISLPADPADPTLQGISFGITPVSVGSTTQTVSYFLDAAVDPFATVFLPPYQAAIGTSALALGAHTIRAVVSDAFGATAEDALTFDVVVNPTVPTVDFGSSVDGIPYLVGTSFVVAFGVEDPLGVATVDVYLDNLSGAPISTGTAPFVVDTTGLSTGVHSIIVVASNSIGAATNPLDPANRLDFRVLSELLAGSPPAPPAVSSVSVPTAADGGAPSRSSLLGTSVPNARIDLVNATLGTIATTVYADGIGNWSATLDADSGDTIEIVAFDYSVSAAPSATTTTVVPAPPVLTEVVIVSGPLVFGALGDFTGVSVEARFDDGSSLDATTAAAYDMTDVAVASVASSGRVVSLAKGTTSLSATFEGVTGTTPVLVDFVSLDGLVVVPNQIVFGDLAATIQLVVTGLFSDGSTGPPGVPVTFVSGDPSIVSVTSGGIASPVANGPANLFVSAAGLVPVAVPVTVDAPDPPPVVQILSPTSGVGFERGDDVALVVEASDLGGGVRQIDVVVSGDVSFSETRVVDPAAAFTSATFNFLVGLSAPLSGNFTARVTATDTNNAISTPFMSTYAIVDETPPSVSIVSPVAETAFNFGQTIDVEVSFTDAYGVTEVGVDVLGAFAASASAQVSPSAASGTVTIPIEVPFGLTLAEAVLTATARDVAGNVGGSPLVPIEITGADITPPETIATTARLGGGSLIEVDYQILTGLEDLDHVELFFRRDGYGTFNRYTNEAGGNANGEFSPISGSGGTILFDSTRMGGDGDFEFATVGVDLAGNREALPTDLGGNFIADPGTDATIATGVPFTVLTTDVELPAGSNNDQNIRIDGATVTLVGAHRWQNVELLNGAVLTHRETSEIADYNMDLEVWTLTVDSTSAVDASGRGHVGGAAGEAGRTLGGADGSPIRDGGSHGGLGGDDPANIAGSGVPLPVYGDLTEPLTLGSGGGGPSAGTSIGGDGGGLILLGAINLVVDGSIRADGDRPIGSGRVGAGSGGGVNLRVRTLSGLGTIEADGGTRDGVDSSGGGGGRIALRALDRTTYDVGGISTRGGDGFYADGAEGTIFVLGEDQATGSLVINGNGPASPETNLLLPPGATFDSLILQNGANVVVSNPLILAGALSIEDGSRLTHAPGDEACLVLTANTIEVDATSSIDVSGRGYAGGAMGEAGRTLGDLVGAALLDGGSYGGFGGDDPMVVSVGGLPGPVYGDPRRPALLGSGGGGPSAGSSIAGDGGGCLRIQATAAVDVDGSILANGAPPTGPGRVGAGSGGSIWITTSRLGGAGVIAANGGTRLGVDGSGGGGGRVALYYDFVDPLADLNGLRNVTALPGDGFYSDGAPGTVYLESTSQVDGTLVGDAGRTTGTWLAEANLTEIGPGRAVAVTPNSLVADGGRVFLPNGLVGLRINPDANQSESFVIVSNDETTITVETPNENAVAFASVAVANAEYAGAWAFDEIVLRGGITQQFADPVRVTGDLTIDEASILTHPFTTASPSYEPALDVLAGAVTISADSAIDLSGRGYPGGAADLTGFTVGNVRAIAGIRDGGSHGGLGGDDRSVEANAGVPAPIYGSATDPVDLGSGGQGPSTGASVGGSGGGRVFLIADDLVVNGTIRVDGGRPAGTGRVGAGAGGTVNLEVGRLEGTGTIEADGGTRDGVDSAGGGGGRIAIRIAESMTLVESQIQARAGDGFYADGGHGSIYLLRPGQGLGDYILDGGDFENPEETSEIPTGIDFDNVILRNGVRVVNGGGISVAGTLRLEANALLTHAAGDAACLVVDADAVIVDATSSIDVSGRGYAGGAAGESGTTLGGLAGAALRDGASHGGFGGDDLSVVAGSGVPGPVYGNPHQPTGLGSGGGGPSSGASIGGAGGGCVRIIANQSIEVDGTILANGARPVGGGLVGAGSGGSIYLTTTRFAGDGNLSANGGTRDGVDSSGGGGGRVAVEYEFVDPLADLDGLRNVTAYGGDGFYSDGAPGTVVFVRGDSAETTLIHDAGQAPGANWAPEASLPEIGPGAAGVVTANTLEGDGGRLFAPQGLIGLRLNPDVGQAETFLITANGESTITVSTPNENGVAFADVASPGARYAGDWRFDEVVLRAGVSAQWADPVTVSGTLSISDASILTHPPATVSPSYEPALDIAAGIISVELDSRIDVSGRGYLGGEAGFAGYTVGNVRSISGVRDGASYGGLGGDDQSVVANDGPPAPVYGSADDPRDLGSGGSGPSGGSGVGGSGGGRVFIVAGDLTVAGSIRAVGSAAFTNGRIGMGSGGTIHLDVDRLLGSGTIEAGGGTLNGASQAGGGGGRISIRATTALVVPLTGVTAPGGDGFYADGQDGSVFVQSP